MGGKVQGEWVPRDAGFSFPEDTEKKLKEDLKMVISVVPVE